MITGPQYTYSALTLNESYGISLEEAERLLARFSRSRKELNMLLAARGRPAGHRPGEFATPLERVCFGVD